LGAAELDAAGTGRAQELLDFGGLTVDQDQVGPRAVADDTAQVGRRDRAHRPR
jgi:hypothetical protein